MTILGHHTELETQQLIGATQSRVDDIQKAFDGFSDSWDQLDTNTRAQWVQDWNNWKHNWQEAAAITLGIDATVAGSLSVATLGPILANTVSVSNVTPDEDGYQRTLDAIYWPGTLDSVVDGNINGLDNRLRTALGGDFARRVPVNQDATDFDLSIIKETAPITDTVDKLLGHDQGALPTPLKKFGLVIAGLAGLVLTGVGIMYYEEAKAVKRVLGR